MPAGARHGGCGKERRPEPREPLQGPRRERQSRIRHRDARCSCDGPHALRTHRSAKTLTQEALRGLSEAPEALEGRRATWDFYAPFACENAR
jgi:hypothetical protein